MKRIVSKGLAAFLLCFVMLLSTAVPVLAANDVPQLVMDARQGVVRVVATYNAENGFSMGTGFVIGTEDEYYVVTNHHVIAEADDVRVFYDTGKSIEATIYEDSPQRDLCILKLKKSLPDVYVLPLQTDDFDTGMAVYALGYPGAADLLSGDLLNYESADDVIADKSSMTVTDGIISAIRDSEMVGDMSRSVRVLQTNTEINKGNSGGPLLDRNGNVVGINTLGISSDVMAGTSGVNGSVHVRELIAMLRSKSIEYYTEIDAEEMRAAANPVEVEPEEGFNFLPILIIGLVVVAGAAIVIILVAYNKKNKNDNNPGNGPGMSLQDYANRGGY